MTLRIAKGVLKNQHPTLLEMSLRDTKPISGLVALRAKYGNTP